MNTRLQVEHTVTEQVTGLDLIALQLMVADGQPLPIDQEDVTISGHAIQARVYAEDPAQAFAPTAGRLIRQTWPAELRCEIAFEEQNVVPSEFDGLLAKLIATGEDRSAAYEKLATGVAETEIIGPKTNLGFLRQLLANAVIERFAYGTDFIDNNVAALAAPPRSIEQVGQLFLLHAATERIYGILQELDDRGVPAGPFDEPDGFQFAGTRQIAAELIVDGTKRQVEFDWGEVDIDDDSIVIIPDEDGGLIGLIDGWTHHMQIPSASIETVPEAGQGDVVAPFPGRVVVCNIGVGDEVAKGETLLVIEAMKMEHLLLAPFDGEITNLLTGVGDQVNQGEVVVKLCAPEQDETV
jgi:3-methylcrotonyl-CoA carboxylase alpha subunit